MTKTAKTTSVGIAAVNELADAKSRLEGRVDALLCVVLATATGLVLLRAVLGPGF
jgi:hypothetical protein